MWKIRKYPTIRLNCLNSFFCFILHTHTHTHTHTSIICCCSSSLFSLFHMFAPSLFRAMRHDTRTYYFILSIQVTLSFKSWKPFTYYNTYDQRFQHLGTQQTTLPAFECRKLSPRLEHFWLVKMIEEHLTQCVCVCNTSSSLYRSLGSPLTGFLADWLTDWLTDCIKTKYWPCITIRPIVKVGIKRVEGIYTYFTTAFFPFLAIASTSSPWR